MKSRYNCFFFRSLKSFLSNINTNKNVMNAKSRFEILCFQPYLFVSSHRYITKDMNLHKFVWDVGHTFVSPYKLHYLNNVTKFFIYVYIKPFNFSYYSSWLLNVIICVTNEYANVLPCLSICLWNMEGIITVKALRFYV